MGNRPRSGGWFGVWKRNALVWRKGAIASLLGQLGEPFLYLFALGLGLGSLVGELDGIPYITFLASGVVCSSAMFTGAFEATYSAFSRMVPQRTWPAMLATPLSVRDVVLGEAVWAATKGTFSATAVLLVGSILGVVESSLAIFAVPVAFLVALCFASLGLMVTAIAKTYDAFLFFTTLVITPMLMLGGVFFPLSRMPEWLQSATQALPLTHGVELVRALVTGSTAAKPAVNIMVLALFTSVALLVATRLVERRMTA